MQWQVISPLATAHWQLATAAADAVLGQCFLRPHPINAIVSPAGYIEPRLIKKPVAPRICPCAAECCGPRGPRATTVGDAKPPLPRFIRTIKSLGAHLSTPFTRILSFLLTASRVAPTAGDQHADACVRLATAVGWWLVLPRWALQRPCNRCKQSHISCEFTIG